MTQETTTFDSQMRWDFLAHCCIAVKSRTWSEETLCRCRCTIQWFFMDWKSRSLAIWGTVPNKSQSILSYCLWRRLVTRRSLCFCSWNCHVSVSVAKPYSWRMRTWENWKTIKLWEPMVRIWRVGGFLSVSSPIRRSPSQPQSQHVLLKLVKARAPKSAPHNDCHLRWV